MGKFETLGALVSGDVYVGTDGRFNTVVEYDGTRLSVRDGVHSLNDLRTWDINKSRMIAVSDANRADQVLVIYKQHG